MEHNNNIIVRPNSIIMQLNTNVELVINAHRIDLTHICRLRNGKSSTSSKRKCVWVNNRSLRWAYHHTPEKHRGMQRHYSTFTECGLPGPCSIPEFERNELHTDNNRKRERELCQSKPHLAFQIVSDRPERLFIASSDFLFPAPASSSKSWAAHTTSPQGNLGVKMNLYW